MNYPARQFDADETRSVAVIAHHVADNTPWLWHRFKTVAEGGAPEPADFNALNAEHAARHGDATKAQVLGLLMACRAEVGPGIGGLMDAQLDIARETGAGSMTVQDMIERVIIGHIDTHRGSIEGAVS